MPAFDPKRTFIGLCDNLYLLEINTQPGIPPTSLVPEQGESVGISFDNLVTWMIENAAYDP